MHVDFPVIFIFKFKLDFSSIWTSRNGYKKTCSKLFEYCVLINNEVFAKEFAIWDNPRLAG
jgi:hypothetical protein